MTISLIFCFSVVVILAVCICCLITAYQKLKRHYDDLQASHKNLEKLNGELRSQRHDYLNHLQVVYGLMQLEEYKELQKYLEPVYKDMQKTGKALKTSKPAINALLKAKMDEAESKEGILLTAKTVEEGLTITVIVVAVLAVMLTIALTVLKRVKPPIILEDELKGARGYLNSSDLEYLVGKEGIAVTDLKPSGKCKIEGIEFDVRAENR